MKIRIEFSQTKSPSYLWVLRLCKQFSSYSEHLDDDGLTHSLELDFEKDWHAFEVLEARLAGWKNTAFYLDGALMPGWRITALRWDREEARRSYSQKFAPQGIFEIKPRTFGDLN